MEIKGFKAWFLFVVLITTAVITTACSIGNHKDFDEI